MRENTRFCFFSLNRIKRQLFLVWLVLLHTDNHLKGNRHCPGQLQPNCTCKTVPSEGPFSRNRLRLQKPSYFAKDGFAKVFNQRKVRAIAMGCDRTLNEINRLANKLYTGLCAGAIFNDLLSKNPEKKEKNYKNANNSTTKAKSN